MSSSSSSSGDASEQIRSPLIDSNMVESNRESSIATSKVVDDRLSKPDLAGKNLSSRADMSDSVSSSSERPSTKDSIGNDVRDSKIVNSSHSLGSEVEKLEISGRLSESDAEKDTFTYSDIVKSHDDLYLWACVFSLYWFKDRSEQISIICLWNSVSICLTLVGMAYIFFVLATQLHGKGIVALIGLLLQYIFAILIIYYSQKQFNAKIKLGLVGMKEKCHNALIYGFKRGSIFLLVQIILLIIGCATLPDPKNQVNLIVITIFSFIPVSLYTSAMVSLTIADQKIAQQYIGDVNKGLEDTDLNELQYNEILNYMKEKEEASPINCFLILGIVSLLFCIFSILVVSGSGFFVAVFLRILIGFLPVIYEIIVSNDMSDQMMDKILDIKWSATSELSIISGRLYMLIVQRPIRATILYTQPSSAQIYSYIMGVVLAFVGSIVGRSVGFSDDQN